MCHVVPEPILESTVPVHIFEKKKEKKCVSEVQPIQNKI